MKGLKDAIDSFKEDLIQSVQDCIRIKSVSSDRDGTQRALEYYLALAHSMGFSAHNVENLGGVIEYGEGEKTYGMIVHLDTVPEGSGWKSPPFGGLIQEGKIYGRGAIDDKGPALSALYALKALKDSGSGISSECKVQIIIGIDEEGIWHTTPKLLKKIKEPDFSFVPDSKFPVVIAEKGLVWLEIKKTLSLESSGYSGITIETMQGGGQSLNIVPDYCEATLRLNDDQKIQIKKELRLFQEQTGYDISLEKNASVCKLISKGKSAHAFICNEGRNAISQLIMFLSLLELEGGQKEFIQAYAQSMAMEYYGESLGLSLEDQLTGKLTVNPGYILIDEKNIILKVDIRFPAKERLDIIKPKIERAFSVFQGNLTIIDSLESLSFPEDDPNIRRLIQVYQDFTGDTETKPLGMGGTTFSKAFKRAVAFGPTFPGMPKVEHQPDEYMEIEHLIKCTEIYALALQSLVRNE
ncbi:MULTISPECIES: Sapep family Mn(2+)-dependent dipeptidase [Dehalobacter]|jgi:succinyl-diaminopimelate desuccinylase|uniref:Dipeptidase n=1 Tax=Dehalobacter restrictus (strain DSM 9455 / PER-K23) TaxID=871738 RepID=A0ABN4BUH5_DEHRP|nr:MULTISPECIES: Sapep family Mn(2+)-dependent dipeptidase [Dehalobacter]AHF09512.1 dipeptidase [Dehalobacter restrictus DSM 9455]MCG1025558.1 Sapep family Mn(2+)-dependent dipeptidase [Dehalobacter sp.]MDJ0306286.1 Sapep family Mn(2+)-dependent dipeptidase [Dehalobacter sp.]OCZ54859.1 dipeptidase [Dehalobacter sp. TeCB1]